MLCFRRRLQTTKPLITSVKHTAGHSRKGSNVCYVGRAHLVLLKVSPVLLDWRRKFSLDIEESCPTVSVWRMRKQHFVGIFPLPALITATNLSFLEKKEVATLSMHSKARLLISTLSTATDNVLLLLWFISEQSVKWFSLLWALLRQVGNTSFICWKKPPKLKHKPSPSQADLLSVSFSLSELSLQLC